MGPFRTKKNELTEDTQDALRSEVKRLMKALVRQEDTNAEIAAELDSVLIHQNVPIAGFN